jgi:hypothetical protein
LGLNSEEASSSPKDDGLDEVNEAILLALSDDPFSFVPSVRQIARKICIPKNGITCILLACRFSAFHSQTSDIFIGFFISAPTVRRQGKASRVELSIQLRNVLLFVRHQG